MITKILLSKVISFLKNKNVSNAKISAEYIFCHVLKIKKNDLFFYLEKEIKIEDGKKILRLIQRRAKKEPLDYIIKNQEFYNLNLMINKNVLIPRVETEILVDLISKKLSCENLDGKILFDICTGSGCIGLALKKRFPKLKVFLSDISKKALQVAKTNAKKNDLNVFLKNSDLFCKFRNIKADFIVCNPPYVSKEEFLNLDFEVKNFEPKIALIAKDRGLEFYRRIEKESINYLNPHGRLFLEIGYRQKNDILNIFSDKKWKNKNVFQDFSNKDRFFFVEIE
jgi:release factor glutamine methyltransferase